MSQATHSVTLAQPSKVVALVIDRSGSMGVCVSAVVDGVNEFLGALKADPERETAVTVTFFDTEVEVLHAGKRPAELSPLTREGYRPNGNTALLDAIGKTLHAIDRDVAGQTPEPDIVCAIVTDGQENSSREFRVEQIQQMIKDRQAKGNWTFVFMGEQQTAWADAARYGIPHGNVKGFDAATQTQETFTSASLGYASFSRSRQRSTQDFFGGSSTPPKATPAQKPAEPAGAGLAVSGITGSGKLGGG